MGVVTEIWLRGRGKGIETLETRGRGLINSIMKNGGWWFHRKRGTFFWRKIVHD